MPSGVKISPQEFKKSFEIVHPELILVDDYTDMKHRVRVKDALGIVYINRPQDLLMGKKPTLESSQDRNLAFKTKAIAVHGDKYDYSQVAYKNARTSISVSCPVHGLFITIPDTHINQGHGCHTCGKLSSEAKRLLTTGAGWNKTAWLSAGMKSKKFSGFKFYIIECSNENEVFIKIGRTYHQVKKRFEDKNKMPYKWKVIFLYEGEAGSVYDMERKYYRLFKKYKYKPLLPFGGMTECFKIEALEIIKNKLTD